MACYNHVCEVMMDHILWVHHYLTHTVTPYLLWTSKRQMEMEWTGILNMLYYTNVDYTFLFWEQMCLHPKRPTWVWLQHLHSCMVTCMSLNCRYVNIQHGIQSDSFNKHNTSWSHSWWLYGTVVWECMYNYMHLAFKYIDKEVRNVCTFLHASACIL